MSKLEFFCNRPTLVALIGFGLDLSPVNAASNTDTPTVSEDKSSTNREKSEESGRVKGLLGYGKGRVVFYLNMNLDSVSVFLNKEDGSPLAMLVQESFLLDLKVNMNLVLKILFYAFPFFMFKIFINASGIVNLKFLLFTKCFSLGALYVYMCA